MAPAGHQGRSVNEKLRSAWLRLLRAELGRRSAYTTTDDARERLIAELDQMAERMRAAPGWVEPTAEERRQGVAEIEDCLRERGYMQS